MRVVTVVAPRVDGRPGRSVRSRANIEALGLAAASLVILMGIWLTCWGRLAQLDEIERSNAGPPVHLTALRGPEPLAPVLTMFASADERQAVAELLFDRVKDPARPVQHVGALADVTIPAARIDRDPAFVALRERRQQRPDAVDVRALSSLDLAEVKPRLVVRTRAEYVAAVRVACLWFFGAFVAAHLVRRWRRTDDDPLILPALLALCGLGLMGMLALRDPLRDTMTVRLFAAGVAGGLAVMLAASAIDFESSRLRRAVGAPLVLAFGLATLLLLFGSGPGSSGVKVNLFGVQPVEGIRLLVVFGLAAYFARRLDLLREYSEPATAERPWLRYVRVPRWKDIRPVLVSMSLVLAFFFLQKDLGPALVLSFVFLALYGIARGRVGFVLTGIAILVGGFAVAYWIGFPSTVRQRVMIWFDPWNNGVPGGNQIAQGLWALATGAFWGSGPGVGSPQTIPAAHTDFVLAAIGEELGFIGIVTVVCLYAMLSWRCLRVAGRAPGDYTAFLATGLALALLIQAVVISAGVLGLFPLSGVVTPFLSYGRSSMVANFLAVGVILSIASRAGPVRRHLQVPLRTLSAVLVLVTIAILARATWVQVVRADELATASSVSEQADGGYRFEYNPRLVAASRLLVRGTIYDRNGLPIAISRADEIQNVPALYKAAGVAPQQPCRGRTERCYPLGGLAFAVLGDWNHQTNWAARNSSYLERDSDARLKGFDDRQEIVEVVNPRTSTRERALRRDYREVLPIARSRYGGGAAVDRLVTREKDVHSSLDARLQLRTALALANRIERGGHARGAAIAIDVASGDVLAAASYPWPSVDQLQRPVAVTREGDVDPWFDRVRYGLYPPGSTFKLLVAAAALRSDRETDRTFRCIRLPGGRVGNRIPGWTRPVRDDLLDKTPHGEVGLRRGLVHSCNAYFAQLALRLGPGPILDAAAAFQIEPAGPPTPEALRRMLPHAGYGQGEVLASPLKLARLAAAIAAGGKVVPVRWTTSAAPVKGGIDARFLSAADAALLSGYMREVVTSGTGRTLQSNVVAIAGKTGTAEVGDGAAHSWFVGFAPADSSRRIAFAVLVENAGYGARTAAPIAGDLVTAARELGLLQ
jgi:cell division protein FtsW (lipid II flippase)